VNTMSGNHTFRPEGVTFFSGRRAPNTEASTTAAGGSMCRRRTLCVTHVAAQPTGRYRTGRNMRPALASSRVAGCRAALRTRSRALAGLRRSRTRAGRSWKARCPMSRRVSDRAAAAIRPRVSGKVTRRTRRASLVTGGTRSVPWAGLALDPSTVSGPARGNRLCRRSGSPSRSETKERRADCVGRRPLRHNGEDPAHRACRRGAAVAVPHRRTSPGRWVILSPACHGGRRGQRPPRPPSGRSGRSERARLPIRWWCVGPRSSGTPRPR